MPRFELGTSSLPRKRSTPELHRQKKSERPGSNRRHSERLKKFIEFTGMTAREFAKQCELKSITSILSVTNKNQLFTSLSINLYNNTNKVLKSLPLC